jgi:Ca2+:H+ antiporter
MVKEERWKVVLKYKISANNQVYTILFSLWINILLLTIPVGFIVNYLYVNSIAIFIINFITIIPLTVILSYTTKEIALHASDILGGLLNVTFRYISPLFICPNII